MFIFVKKCEFFFFLTRIYVDLNFYSFRNWFFS